MCPEGIYKGGEFHCSAPDPGGRPGWTAPRGRPGRTDRAAATMSARSETVVWTGEIIENLRHLSRAGLQFTSGPG